MSTVRFICPFCPLVGHSGDVEAVSEGTEENPGECYVTHSFPPCARFEAISEDDPESFADFIAEARRKLAETAPS